jgi:putative Ca2+/H+ antiporter (TMEM165/GDT1 family)
VNWIAALTAFALIFPIELPDKTFIATIVLATRLPGRMVWLGVSAAFGVQCVVAVVAGRLIAYLPQQLVLAITGLAFLIGGVLLLRGAKGEAKEEVLEEAEFEARVKKEARGPLTGFRAALLSFGIIFAAEWGDLSQILTAGLVAQGKDSLGVFVGGASRRFGARCHRRKTADRVRFSNGGQTNRWVSVPVACSIDGLEDLRRPLTI